MLVRAADPADAVLEVSHACYAVVGVLSEAQALVDDDSKVFDGGHLVAQAPPLGAGVP